MDSDSDIADNDDNGPSPVQNPKYKYSQRFQECWLHKYSWIAKSDRGKCDPTLI